MLEEKELNVNVDEWCKEKKVSQDPIPCIECAKPLRLIKVVEYEGGECVKTERCSCNPEIELYRLAPSNIEERKMWESLEGN